MQERGFEPPNSLRDGILSPAHLTTLLLLRKNLRRVFTNPASMNFTNPVSNGFTNPQPWSLYFSIVETFKNPFCRIFSETAIVGWKHLFPFRTQKLSLLRCRQVVSEMKRNQQAVFHILYFNFLDKINNFVKLNSDSDFGFLSNFLMIENFDLTNNSFISSKEIMFKKILSSCFNGSVI